MPLAEYKNEYPEMIERLLCIRRSNRAGHAYLFTGDYPEHLTEFGLAWVGVFACVCPGADGDACGSCPACKQIKAGSHPGLVHLRPESKNRQITIEQVREFEHRVYLTSSGDRFKAALISDADCLNERGQNALLKTLEEPPAGTMIVLLSANARRLLPTIRSRCQTITLTRNRRCYDLAASSGVFDILSLLQHDADAAAAIKCASRLRSVFAGLKEQAASLVAEMEDEDMAAFVEQDAGLAKRLDVMREARTEAEYRRMRGDLLEALHAWFCRRALVAAGVGQADLPCPEMTTAAAGGCVRSLARADEDVKAADVLLRQLAGNMEEGLALDSFCLGVCRGHVWKR